LPFLFLFLSSAGSLNLGLEALKWRAIVEINKRKNAKKTSKKIIAVAVAKLALDSLSTFYTLAKDTVPL